MPKFKSVILRSNSVTRQISNRKMAENAKNFKFQMRQFQGFSNAVYLLKMFASNSCNTGKVEWNQT